MVSGSNKPAEILELDAYSDLPLSTGQILQRGAERRGSAFKALDGGGIVAIEEVKHLEQNLGLHSLPKIEAFGDTHVYVEEGRSGLRISRV